MTQAPYNPVYRPALASEDQVAAMHAKLAKKLQAKVSVVAVADANPHVEGGIATAGAAPVVTPSAPPLEWQRAGEYAMKTPDGRWSIAKTFHNGVPMYRCWRLTPDSCWFAPIGPPHDSFTKAKDYAQTVANR